MAETASKIELFGKWSYDDVEISDIALEDYIAVSSMSRVAAVARTGGTLGPALLVHGDLRAVRP